MKTFVLSFIIIMLLLQRAKTAIPTKLQFIQLTCTRIISTGYGKDWISLKVNVPEIKDEVLCPHSGVHNIKPGETWKFPNLVVPIKSLATIVLTQYNFWRSDDASKVDFFITQPGYYIISISIKEFQQSKALTVQFLGLSFTYNETYTPTGDYSLLVLLNDTMPCCSTYYNECSELILKLTKFIILVFMILIYLL